MSVSKRTVDNATELMSAKKGDPEAERAMQIKKDWNSYHQWLKEQGLAGSPELDKGVGDNNVGLQMVKKYQKLNPNTLVTPENIPEIQGHFKNYRDHVLNLIKTKKADYSGDMSKIDTDFMPHLSRVDGIPGQFTSNSVFPDSWLTTVYKGPGGVVEKKETVNTGLVNTIPKL